MKMFSRLAIWRSQLSLAIFSLLVFFIPMQRSWHKLLDKLGQKMATPAYSFDVYFANRMQISFIDIFILTLGVFALFTKNTQGAYRRSFPFNRIVFGYLLCCALSVLLSGHRDYFAGYFILLRYAFFWGLYWLIIEGFIERKATIISTAFLSASAASVMVQSCICIAQYFTQYHLGLKRFGETSFARAGKSPAAFQMMQDSLWIFSDKTSSSFPLNIIRSYGTLGHPNVIGWYLSMGVVATMFLLVKARSKISKTLIGAAAFFEIFALHTTYCRSALLGLIFSLSLFLAFKKFREKFFMCAVFILSSTLFSSLFFLRQIAARNHYHSCVSIFVVFCITILSGVCVGYTLQLCKQFFLFANTHQATVRSFVKKAIFIVLILIPVVATIQMKYKNRTSQVISTVLTLADEARLTNPKIAINMMIAKPLFGVGYSMYWMDMRDFIDPGVKEEMIMAVHNIFLLVGAETGVLGLMFFLALISSPLYFLSMQQLSDDAYCLLAMLVVCLFVGMFDFHLITAISPMLYFVILLALVTLKAKQPFENLIDLPSTIGKDIMKSN